MRWLLNILLFYGIKTIYSKSIIKIRQPEVNTFLEKILQSDKFDELADRIADRAVKKLGNHQKSNKTGSPINEEGVYRSRVSTVKQKRRHKHEHGKINAEAVLNRAFTLNSLKLIYKNLKNKQGQTSHHEEDEEYMNNNSNEGSVSSNSKEVEQIDYEKKAKDIQADFHENIKTLSDENFDNPFGEGETITWDRKTLGKQLMDSQTAVSGSNAENITPSISSLKENDNFTRTTRTEGDKQFILEEHSDYKQYNEELANVHTFNASRR